MIKRLLIVMMLCGSCYGIEFGIGSSAGGGGGDISAIQADIDQNEIDSDAADAVLAAAIDLLQPATISNSFVTVSGTSIDGDYLFDSMYSGKPSFVLEGTAGSLYYDDTAAGWVLSQGMGNTYTNTSTEYTPTSTEWYQFGSLVSGVTTEYNGVGPEASNAGNLDEVLAGGNTSTNTMQVGFGTGTNSFAGTFIAGTGTRVVRQDLTGFAVLDVQGATTNIEFYVHEATNGTWDIDMCSNEVINGIYYGDGSGLVGVNAQALADIWAVIDYSAAPLWTVTPGGGLAPSGSNLAVERLSNTLWRVGLNGGLIPSGSETNDPTWVINGDGSVSPRYTE